MEGHIVAQPATFVTESIEWIHVRECFVKAKAKGNGNTDALCNVGIRICVHGLADLSSSRFPSKALPMIPYSQR